MRIALMVFPLVIGVACGVGTSSVKGTGEPVTREIPVAMLNGITVDDAIDVIVLRGDTQRVRVRAQADLIGLVKTKVDNGMWEIATTQSYSTDREFTIELTVPMLNSVIVAGSGDVRSEEVFNTGKTHLAVMGSGGLVIDTIHEGLLDVLIEGSGSVSVIGTCRELELRSTGSGSFNALGLAVNEAEMTLEGSGGAEITAITRIDAEIRGSGGLRYKGKPEMRTTVEGSGSVTPLP